MAQFGMVMAHFAYLNEGDSPAELVNHLLVSVRRPPFNADISFSPAGNDPKGNIGTRQFMDLRCPLLLFRRQMNISPEFGRHDLKIQFLIEEVDISMETMVRPIVRVVNEWISAVDDRNVPVPFVTPGHIRRVL